MPRRHRRHRRRRRRHHRPSTPPGRRPAATSRPGPPSSVAACRPPLCVAGPYRTTDRRRPDRDPPGHLTVHLRSPQVSDDDLAKPPPAAGWYADPFARFAHRYWDGAGWTAYARNGEVQWDPEPLEPVTPVDPGLRGLGIAAAGAVVSVVLALGFPVLFGADDDIAGVLLSSLGLWTGLIGTCLIVSHRRGTGSLVR